MAEANPHDTKAQKQALSASWNIVLVIVAVAVLCSTREERPNKPIRAWIIVYAVQCMVTVILAIISYHAHNRRREPSRFLRGCIRMNDFLCVVWWVLGIYWVASGGHKLKDKAPSLFGLAIASLVYQIVIIVVVVWTVAALACCCFLIQGRKKEENLKEAKPEGVAKESDIKIDMENSSVGANVIEPLQQDKEPPIGLSSTDEVKHDAIPV